jgi:hypothetical protein
MECCVPWGDTITLPFGIEADIVYMQDPPFPPAFSPAIPQGHFYPGDQIGYRTAQKVDATVTIVYMAYTDPTICVSNTIIIQVRKKCAPGETCPSS